jgi:hypothetical protein
VVFDVERILGIQVQMRKSSGQSKYAARLRGRNGFQEALIYLKFAGGVDPARKELLARWLAPAREEAAPPAEHPRRHEHPPRPDHLPRREPHRVPPRAAEPAARRAGLRTDAVGRISRFGAARVRARRLGLPKRQYFAILSA